MNFCVKIFSDVFSWISFFWFFFLFCSHFPFPLFSCFFLIFLFYLDFPFSPFFLNFLSFRFLIFPNFPLIFLSRFFSWWWTSVFNKRSEKLLKRAKNMFISLILSLRTLGHLYFLYARIKYSTIKMKMIASLIFCENSSLLLLLWAGSLKSNLKRSEKKRKVLKIDDRLANVMNTLLEWLGWNCHFIFQTTFHFMHSNVQLVKKS